MPVRNFQRDEIFTPYARIPPIKKSSLQNNLKSTSSSSTDYQKPSKVPFTISKLPMLRGRGYSKTKIPPKKLIRRNTYVVLEPLVLKKTYKSDNDGIEEMQNRHNN